MGGKHIPLLYGNWPVHGKRFPVQAAGHVRSGKGNDSIPQKADGRALKGHLQHRSLLPRFVRSVSRQPVGLAKGIFIAAAALLPSPVPIAPPPHVLDRRQGTGGKYLKPHGFCLPPAYPVCARIPAGLWGQTGCDPPAHRAGLLRFPAKTASGAFFR